MAVAYPPSCAERLVPRDAVQRRLDGPEAAFHLLGIESPQHLLPCLIGRLLQLSGSNLGIEPLETLLQTQQHPWCGHDKPPIRYTEHARPNQAVLTKGLAVGQTGRNAPAPTKWLFLKHALQQLDLLGEVAIVLNHLFNLPHGMLDGRMVAPTETTADLGQGPRCERLGEVHGDLARPHHIARTA